MGALWALALRVLGSRAALVGTAAAAAFDIGPFGGDGVPKRRRRKRALTKMDREDIAFIVATLGEPAGRKAVLVMLATR